MILESEFDTADARSLSKQQDLEREVKMLTETLQFKDGEVTRKNEMLEKEKRNVYELERSLQNKLF
jgi:predicted  nucleic acid-binding Zn-ribbon protein